MSDSMTSDRRRRWWYTMRRSFGVPDDDIDETALGTIQTKITDGNGAFFGINNALAVTTMTTAVLDLGSSGELDRLSAVDDDRYPFEVAEAYEAVYNQSHDEAWPNALSADAMRLRSETDALVDRVVAGGREPSSPG